jgi:hypothetical protein
LAAAALAAAVAVCAAVRRQRRLVRQLRELARERTSAELVAGRMCQDLEVFQRRIDELVAGRAVLVEADRVLTEALVVHHAAGPGGSFGDVYDPYDPNSTEGGSV